MSDDTRITEEHRSLDPVIARIVGLLLRMMDDRKYGSIIVEIRRGRVVHVEERRTYKPDEDDTIRT